MFFGVFFWVMGMFFGKKLVGVEKLLYLCSRFCDRPKRGVSESADVTSFG